MASPQEATSIGHDREHLQAKANKKSQKHQEKLLDSPPLNQLLQRVTYASVDPAYDHFSQSLPTPGRGRRRKNGTPQHLFPKPRTTSRYVDELLEEEKHAELPSGGDAGHGCIDDAAQRGRADRAPDATTMAPQPEPVYLSG